MLANAALWNAQRDHGSIGIRVDHGWEWLFLMAFMAVVIGVIAWAAANIR